MSGQVIGTWLDFWVLMAYFAAVVGFGMYFGKYATTTKDFFFGGQRFSWWLIAFSCVASTVGSYSFIKYSEAGYRYGLCSIQSYLNDWFWAPILLLVWLPIIYYQRVQSIPEFFERRFGTHARVIATLFILLYLVGYVGINLLTLGVALHAILGWHVYTGAFVAALSVTFYVYAGGQTSVIMTDLVQGITLLVVGLGLFVAGVWHFGGLGTFWALLPESHRYAFSEFNTPDRFSFIGIFAQDGLANSGAFVLMNQGMIMRFMALRTVRDANKMAVCWMLILMPLAAITVSGGGWIARALAAQGELEVSANNAFVQAAALLCRPGIFGFVLAALLAALMSTADTLINAASAVFINDIYRPYFRKNKEDRHYLRMARLVSLCTAAIGMILVPVFHQYASVYHAHGMFTAAITPPIVMAILLGVLWKRFNHPAALTAMLGGGGLVLLSMFPPFSGWLIKPFAFGMGPDSYDFMRALFGLAASGALGVAVALLTKPQPLARIIGLVSGTQLDAMRMYKGKGELNRRPGKCAYLRARTDAALPGTEDALVPRQALDAMAAAPGDLVYACDRRWWLGGLHSIHVKIAGVSPDDALHMGREAMALAHFKEEARVYLEKIF